MALAPLPGKEARFVCHSPIGDVVLNDLINGRPYFFVRDIGGWRSTADLEAASEKKTGQEGEKPRPSLRAGKTITFEGQTEANNLPDLREYEDFITAAFWDSDNEYTCSIELWDGDSWEAVYEFNYRAISVDGPETQQVSPNHVTGGYLRPCVVTMRLSDPKFYSVDEQTVVSGALGSVSGGIIPPVTPPILVPASSVGGNAAVLNEGSAPADPLLRVWGPVTAPRLDNDDAQVYLEFPGVVLAAGQWLDIDFKTRNILLEGTSDFKKFRRGTWWGRAVSGLLPVTVNNIRLSGNPIADPARVEVIFKPPRY